MATLNIDVNIDYLRSNGTHHVRIRVTHNRKHGYIKTPHYVTPNQLRKEKGKVTGTIKDRFIIERLNDLMKEYREAIDKLGPKVNIFNEKQLAQYLEKEEYRPERKVIDFIAFGWEQEQNLRANGQDSYADSFKNTLNSLEDFFHRKSVDITEITPYTLDQYEAFQKTERTLKRKDRFGKDVNIKEGPMKQSGVAVYLRNIRRIFKLAKRKYNNQHKGEILIQHYPFEEFQIKKGPAPEKRNLDANVIVSIRDTKDHSYWGTHGTNRVSLARDIFMLSFYLVGINPTDLFHADTIKNGRLEYKRRKTKGRRSDEAFISIKIEPEAVRLIEKYRDPSGERVFIFHKMYADKAGFLRALNKGLRRLSKELDLSMIVTMYYARHSWSSIARNECGVSKDDVHEALNHTDPNMKVTDTYIKKDWSHIDRANRKVLDYIKSCEIR